MTTSSATSIALDRIPAPPAGTPALDRAGTTAAPLPLAGAHVRTLDGVRAFAIAGVLGVHAGVPGFQAGWLGVDLFFALSGFLITTLLLGEQARTGSISLKHFWARRFLRLLPAYYLYALGITLAMWLWSGSVRQEHGGWSPGEFTAALWLHAMNFAPLGGIWNGQAATIHLWSLAVEEQYYLFWPLVLWALLSRPGWLLPAAALLSAAVLGVFLFAADDVERTYMLYARGFSLFLASAVAVALHRRLAAGADPARWLPAPGRIALAAAIATAAAFAVSALKLLPEAAVRLAFLPGLAGLYVLLVASLWYRPAGGALSAVLANPAMVWIGRVSYGIYLYHEAVRLFVWWATSDLVAGWRPMAAYGLRLGCYLALSVAVASLSYLTFERFFLARKARFRPA